jgi:hypothetical protein
MLRFQQRVHLLIASILIVPGDEFRMLDELRGVAGNSRDQDLPGGGVSRRAGLCTRDGRCRFEIIKAELESKAMHREMILRFE